jgi:uncharacterized MAPEG superfamily protein
MLTRDSALPPFPPPPQTPALIVCVWCVVLSCVRVWWDTTGQQSSAAPEVEAKQRQRAVERAAGTVTRNKRQPLSCQERFVFVFVLAND